MKPRRNILLFADWEVDASALAFALNQQSRFKVQQAVTGIGFVSALRNGTDWSLIIIPFTGDNDQTARLAAIAKKAAPFCPVMILGWVQALPDHIPHANLFLPFGTSNAEIIERSRVLITRKRGPHRGGHMDTINGKRKLVQPTPNDIMECVA